MQGHLEVTKFFSPLIEKLHAKNDDIAQHIIDTLAKFEQNVLDRVGAVQYMLERKADKKVSYRRVTARCVLSVVILPITTQQCRNYLYSKSWPTWMFSWRQCVINVCTQPRRDQVALIVSGVINKPTTDELCISPVYRRLAVVKFSKSTM